MLLSRGPTLLATLAAALLSACSPNPGLERGSELPDPAPAESAAPAPTHEATTAPAAEPAKAAPTFAEDVAFLSKHAPVKVLESPTGGRVAVSGQYQARVMTSAVGATANSLGFVNRSFIEQGRTGTAFDNYGGEDRFWLGPEGSQNALYFPAGKAFEFSNWQTPHAFQEGEWQAKPGGDSTSITFVQSLRLSNYASSEFKLDVERKISILTADQAKAALGVDIPASVKWVGFATDNSISNKGQQAWTEAKGLLSIWILGMFKPAPGTLVIAPFDKAGKGAIVNDQYFGKVGPDRLRVNEDKGFVLFKCDGQFRSKIGLSASRAKSVIGSYSAEAALLTIVRYSRPKGATRYVNNLWDPKQPPYSGDVNNSYNDGPVEPGKPSLGGFYELESSSPAAALAPGASLKHVHETYHFSGPPEALETLANKVLGVSLTDVQAAGM